MSRPRRRHAAASTEASLEEQDAFKNKLPAATKALCGKNPKLEVWALDEHRVGLKAILRYVWAKRGERTTAWVWPLVDAPLSNRTFDSIDQLDATLSEQCVQLTQQRERIRSLMLYDWWPGGADHEPDS